jgi:hypothetical protein
MRHVLWDHLLSGAVVSLCLVASLFFWRFWKETRDRLFAFFAGAFDLLALNYLLLALNPRTSEVRPYFYLIRLLAFLLIIAGILDKNRGDDS